MLDQNQNNQTINPLYENVIHVWQTDLRDLHDIDSLKLVLSKDEKNKAERFYFEKDRNCSIIARSMLRHLLQYYTGISATDIRFSYGEQKKPHLDSAQQSKRSPIYFNVSHSGTWILYAFAHRACIGVDVELIKKDRDILNISEHFFTPFEHHQIMSAPNDVQHKRFYQLWAHKEAFIKATGKGLFQSLQDFEIILPDDHDPEDHYASLRILGTNAHSADINWTLKDLKLFMEYESAIAVDTTTRPIIIECYRTIML